MSRRSSILWVLLVLIAVGLGAFIWQVVVYYQAIRSGEVSPILLQRLESSVSQMKANQKVTEADLARLANPSSPSMGEPGAPVTIVEFLDYGCPFCRRSFEPVRELISNRPQDVRLIIRDFPVEELHPGAIAAAVGARCAQEQGKFWAYHDKLFLLDVREFDETLLAKAAQEVGLDETEWNACRSSDAILAKIRKDVEDGLAAGVSGTPTFFFNGTRIQGALDRDMLKLLVDTFVKQSK
jgi:protein-disulfide isomerase